MIGLKLTPTPENNNPYELPDDVNEFLGKYDYAHIVMVKKIMMNNLLKINQIPSTKWA